MIFDSWINTPLELYPPLRCWDPGSRNHVQDIPTLVHDFRFLDRYAPRIEPPLRSSDPGSRNHVHYIPTLVHDFRFLDLNAPRIVPPSKLWSRITKPCTLYTHSSAWFSIPGSIRPSNWNPLRSSDPGSRNHVHYIPTLVHDFRFLDQYTPRIVPSFEAHIQDHETMYCSPLHPQWGIPSLLGTRFPINQKKYFDFLQDACIFLVRQIFGISQKVRLTNPIVPNSY